MKTPRVHTVISPAEAIQELYYTGSPAPRVPPDTLLPRALGAPTQQSENQDHKVGTVPQFDDTGTAG